MSILMDISVSFFLWQNVIPGLPLVNYPDVCTNSLQSGKAFWSEHMQFLREKHPDVPTDIHGFLRYRGIQHRNPGSVGFYMWYCICMYLDVGCPFNQSE